jgi:hypothetical protein
MLEPQLPIEKLHEDIFVARQPIFAKDRSLWGYELSSGTRAAPPPPSSRIRTRPPPGSSPTGYNPGPAQPGPGGPHPQSTSRSGCSCPGSPGPCPPILRWMCWNPLSPSKQVLAALGALRMAGYTLALDDYAGQEHLDPFLAVVQVVKVDFSKLASRASTILKLASQLRQPGRVLLAEKGRDPRGLRVLPACSGFELVPGILLRCARDHPRPQGLRSRGRAAPAHARAGQGRNSTCAASPRPSSRTCPWPTGSSASSTPPCSPGHGGGLGGAGRGAARGAAVEPMACGWCCSPRPPQTPSARNWSTSRPAAPGS